LDGYITPTGGGSEINRNGGLFTRAESFLIVSARQWKSFNCSGIGYTQVSKKASQDAQAHRQETIGSMQVYSHISRESLWCSGN
jgi:hypothetical protein